MGAGVDASSRALMDPADEMATTSPMHEAAAAGVCSSPCTTCSQRPKAAAPRLTCPRCAGCSSPPKSSLIAASTACRWAALTLATSKRSRSCQKLLAGTAPAWPLRSARVGRRSGMAPGLRLKACPRSIFWQSSQLGGSSASPSSTPTHPTTSTRPRGAKSCAGRRSRSDAAPSSACRNAAEADDASAGGDGCILAA